ncbi:MAG: GNAT family N-acetyltransferase, partial [Halobaculum sp.]
SSPPPAARSRRSCWHCWSRETTDATTVIRTGRVDDEPQLRRLQSHLREPSPELLSHALSVGTVFVSVVAETDRPAGYVLPVAGDGIHLAELVVDPSFRREGRARRLLRRAITAADDRVTLLVHPDNEAARSLYEQVGFTVVGRRREFYDDADALVMAHDGSADTE